MSPPDAFYGLEFYGADIICPGSIMAMMSSSLGAQCGAEEMVSLLFFLILVGCLANSPFLPFPCLFLLVCCTSECAVPLEGSSHGSWMHLHMLLFGLAKSHQASGVRVCRVWTPGYLVTMGPFMTLYGQDSGRLDQASGPSNFQTYARHKKSTVREVSTRPSPGSPFPWRPSACWVAKILLCFHTWKSALCLSFLAVPHTTCNMMRAGL